MDINHKIAEIVYPILENMGYDLVRVLLMGTQRQTLQIMVERKDNAIMTIKDCTSISRALSPVLEVEDPIKGSYALEVSSPGVNRPLIKPQDYVRFNGQNAKIETNLMINNRRKFNGIIKDFTKDNEVVIAINDETYNIPYESIKSAKLSVADEIFNKTPKKQPKTYDN